LVNLFLKEKIMSRLISFLTVLVVIPALAACGTTKSDRALSGAGLGAGAGAAAGALTGGNPVAGAVIGGAAGAAAGALTDEDDVNFGKPVWR
jgi:osmotically inducible lipoprotein OsmB